MTKKEKASEEADTRPEQDSGSQAAYESETQETLSDEQLLEAARQASQAAPQEAAASEDYKDKYFRLLADNENLRRRLQKDQHDRLRISMEKVILDLLHPLDSFEKALNMGGKAASDEVKNWAVGFKMILGQFEQWLEGQGVRPFNAEGQPFSPHLHEAVEKEESSNHPDGTILRVVQKGYKMNEKVLRPAKVVVAEHKEDENAKAILPDIDEDDLALLGQQAQKELAEELANNKPENKNKELNNGS